jgi:MOSC domain-containing protein YiiM
MTALPPTVQAQVLALFNAPPGLEPFGRVRVPAMRLEAGLGIEGHKSAGKTRTRQINVVQARLYRWFEDSFGRELVWGRTGENVVVDDALDLNWLAMGTRLSLGTALCEVRMYRMPCKPMATRQGIADRDLFVGHVGIFLEVVTSGEVREGSTLQLASPGA